MSAVPSTLISFLLLCVGVVILVVAGDILVRGSAALARKWGIPSLIVGLTIVAFGTSAPELVVAIQAVQQGASELAIGNVIGSNIANVFLVLGLPALIIAIPTNMPGILRNATIAVFATLILIAIILIPGPIVFWQGAILFGGIILYLIWMFFLAKAGADDPTLDELTDLDDMDGMPKAMSIIAIFIILGIIGLMYGGDLIVKNAAILAGNLGVSEAIIGLSIVAIGTSLPELATVMLAAYRGHSEVAMGNVLGSNVFNIFAVGGAASLTGDITVPERFMNIDIWVMLAAILILFFFAVRKAPIGRITGIVFLIFYGVYMFIGTTLPA